MKPYGRAHMCLVEVEGVRRAADCMRARQYRRRGGMKRRSRTSKPQDGVLELLLIRPPARAAGVPDRGGRCPLRPDAFGPGGCALRRGEAPLREAHPDQRPRAARQALHPVRQVPRVAAEVAGDPLIDFSSTVAPPRSSPTPTSRSRRTSPATPSRSARRHADRERVPVPRPPVGPRDRRDVVPRTCAVGCRGALCGTSNRIVRLLGVDSEPVNQGWLCDKGRYGYEWVHHADACGRRCCARQVSWSRCRARGARCRRRRPRTRNQCCHDRWRTRHRRKRLRLGALLAKGVLGTDNVEQFADGLPAEVVLGLPPATIAEDLDRARRHRARRSRSQGRAPGPLPARPPRGRRPRRSRHRDLPARRSPLRVRGIRHAPGEAGLRTGQFATEVGGDGAASVTQIEHRHGRARRP